jgi:hypothetical protein
LQHLGSFEFGPHAGSVGGGKYVVEGLVGGFVALVGGCVAFVGGCVFGGTVNVTFGVVYSYPVVVVTGGAALVVVGFVLAVVALVVVVGLVVALVVVAAVVFGLQTGFVDPGLQHFGSFEFGPQAGSVGGGK